MENNVNMKWQDIETAPKNEWVLVKGGLTNEELQTIEDDGENAILLQDIERPVVAKCIIIYDRGDDSYYEWVFAHWDCMWFSTYCKPTHWMPIPQ